MITSARRFYAAYTIQTTQFSPEDRQTVLMFSSRAERDSWVRYALNGREEPLMTRGGRREPVTRREAAAILRENAESMFGGRQSGYAMLQRLEWPWLHPTPEMAT